MKPAGPLMIEHRLIERMLRLLERELDNMKSAAEADAELILAGVDFFRTYADRTHHGKEEDILFAALRDKAMSDDEREMMRRLTQEHVWARQAVGKLASATDRYRKGDAAAVHTMIYELGKIVQFYPEHIAKEDKHFFIPVMDYFTPAEQQAMLERFWEFDRAMIHEKYRNVVEEQESRHD
ncbi:MAG: hemerythrin domain-containing protein [Phycisphaerales bacterium]